MEHEGSLPHSQQPDTCLCPEPESQVHALSYYFVKIQFNIIVPSKRWYYQQ